MVTCWERADLLALLYRMFSCVFVTFPYGILGQVWYLIESIPDLCLLPYYYTDRSLLCLHLWSIPGEKDGGEILGLNKSMVGGIVFHKHNF